MVEKTDTRIINLPLYALKDGRFSPVDGAAGNDWFVWAADPKLLNDELAEAVKNAGDDTEAVVVENSRLLKRILRSAFWAHGAQAAFAPAKAVRAQVIEREKLDPRLSLADARAVFAARGIVALPTTSAEPRRSLLSLWRLWLRRGNYTTIIGLAISALCVVFLLQGIVWAEMVEALQMVNSGWVVICFLLVLVAMFLRGWRWRALYLQRGDIGLDEAVAISAAGIAINQILPARVGEFARALMVRATNGSDATSALGTIVIERLIDVSLSLILLAVGMWLLPDIVGHRWLFAGTMALVTLIVGIVIFVLAAERIENALIRYGSGGRFFGNLIRLLSLGLKVGRSLPAVAEAVTVSSVYLLVIYLLHFLLASVFPGVGKLLPDWWIPLYLGATNIGRTVPSAPGSAGSYELVAVLVLTAFGLSPSAALAFGLAVHIVQSLPAVVAGLLCLLYWYFKTVKRVAARRQL